ncbi:MAG: hypothetical protein Q7S22_06025, partial [Candidatus Micrarchaeota archaeon]|nr:hypothetical protein [Candidatus Micrarchaeota archaeon]
MVGGAFVFNASEVSRSILGATPSVVDPSQKINELFDKIIIDAGHKPFTSVSVQAQKKVSPVVTDFLQLAKVITQMPSKDNNELRELQKVLSGFDPKMKDYLIVGGSSKPNPKYADAMTAFQTYLNIDKTGKLNQETLDALRVKWNATQSTSLDAVPAVVAAPEPKVGRPYVPPPRRTEETPKSDVMSTEDQWAEILNGCVAQELRSAQLLKQNYDPSYLNNVNEILQNVRDLQGQGTPGLPRARQFLISAELLLTKIELQVRINDDYNTRKYDDFDTNAYDHTVLTNINNNLQTAYTRITQRNLSEARRLLEKVAADLDNLEGSVKKSVVAKPDGAIASEPTVEAGAVLASVETSTLNPAELESRRQLLIGRAKAVLDDKNTILDNRVFVREANKSLADGKAVQTEMKANNLTEANRILDVAEWSIYYAELNTRTNVLSNVGFLIDSWVATNPFFYYLGLYEIGGGNRD